MKFELIYGKNFNISLSSETSLILGINMSISNNSHHFYHDAIFRNKKVEKHMPLGVENKQKLFVDSSHDGNPQTQTIGVK